jgi:hypothetical protein
MTDKVQEIMSLVHKFSVASTQGNAVSAMRLCAEIEAKLVEVVAPPVPEPTPNAAGVPLRALLGHCRPEGLRFDMPPLVLSGYQLREALDFLAPDGDADQLEQEVCIALRDEGKDVDGEMRPRGMYCWLEEYPDEGSIILAGEATTSQPASEPVAPIGTIVHLHMPPGPPHWSEKRIEVALNDDCALPDGAPVYATPQPASEVVAPPVPEPSDSMREKFESWVNRGERTPLTVKDDRGVYLDNATHFRWTGWQEAVRLLTPTEATHTQPASEPVAWCALNINGQIKFFDGRPMVMIGPVGNYIHNVPLFPFIVSKPLKEKP